MRRGGSEGGRGGGNGAWKGVGGHDGVDVGVCRSKALHDGVKGCGEVRERVGAGGERVEAGGGGGAVGLVAEVAAEGGCEAVEADGKGAALGGQRRGGARVCGRGRGGGEGWGRRGAAVAGEKGLGVGIRLGDTDWGGPGGTQREARRERVVEGSAGEVFGLGERVAGLGVGWHEAGVGGV